MKITVAQGKHLEKHNLLTKFIRIFTVPLLNNLSISFIQKLMKKSSHDARRVLETVGSTHALEVMYTRYHRSLFYRGILNGLADLFWHHAVSQPKALRNRLKIVEEKIEEEISQLVNGDKDATILTVGGGSSRALIHCIDRLYKKNLFDSHKIKVINVDKDKKAIELGKELAQRFNLNHVFEWINDDARNLKSLIKPETIDVVEMVGLLDYFSEERGIEVIGQIFNLLRKKGVFIVANIYPNSERIFVSKTGWPKMYYRTPEDLASILSKAGFTEEPTVIFEPLRVHIIQVVRK